MGSYLQRLVARAAPSSRPAFEAFIRSASPLATLDQRYTAPGFDASVGFGGLVEPLGGEAKAGADMPMAEGHASTVASPAGRTRTASAAVRPGVYVAENDGGRPGHVRARTSPHRTDAPHGVHSDGDVNEAARSEESTASGAPAVHRATGRLPAVSSPEVTVTTRPQTDRAAAGSANAPAPMGVVTPAFARRPEPPRVDPFAEDAARSAPAIHADSYEMGPVLEIGSIEVEVVPSPAQAPSRAAAAFRPVTAESVSRIGPLGGRRRSNLRFGSTRS